MKGAKKNEGVPEYGNWMPKKFILIGVSLTLAFSILCAFFPALWVKIASAIIAIFCGANSIYAIYAYHMFSPDGGNLQEKIHDKLISTLQWDGVGKCLEIGCGSAPVAIKLAKKYPTSTIVASDYWEKTYFEYTEQQCYKNAQIEGVADRMEFKFADAAKLPFEDGAFDAVVSNLTFHEVKSLSASERHKALSEALRVLKKGGSFAFQDLFQLKFAFKDFEHLQKTIQNEAREIHWEDSFETLQIPHWLDNVIMLKGLGIFYGKK